MLTVDYNVYRFEGEGVAWTAEFFFMNCVLAGLIIVFC